MSAARRKPVPRPAGPFTAHHAITCTIIKRGEEVFQSCATMEGARALADLLNHAVSVANQQGALILAGTTRVDTVGTDDAVGYHSITPAEIVAAALARAFDWRLELPLDRARRIAADAEYEAKRARLGRNAGAIT